MEEGNVDAKSGEVLARMIFVRDRNPSGCEETRRGRHQLAAIWTPVGTRSALARTYQSKHFGPGFAVPGLSGTAAPAGKASVRCLSSSSSPLA
jgi:hypothetical protein